jgi:hypothetical protein
MNAPTDSGDADQPQTVSVAQAAAMFGISVELTDDLIRFGGLDSIQVGGTPAVLLDDVHDILGTRARTTERNGPGLEL